MNWGCMTQIVIYEKHADIVVYISKYIINKYTCIFILLFLVKKRCENLKIKL